MASGGVRGLFAFWMGGAGVPSGIPPLPPAPELGTGGGLSAPLDEYHKRRPKRWDDERKAREQLRAQILAATGAEEKVQREAAKADSPQLRDALDEAATAARGAIEQAKAAEEAAAVDAAIIAQTERLRRALDAAASAQSVMVALRRADAAIKAALELRRAIEEAEDEEEAIALLLLH